MLLQGQKCCHCGMGIYHMRDIYFHLPFHHRAPCKMITNPIHAAIFTEVLALCIEIEFCSKRKMKKGKDFSLGPSRTCTAASPAVTQSAAWLPRQSNNNTFVIQKKNVFFSKWKFWQKYYQQYGNDIFHTGCLNDNKPRPSNSSSWTIKITMQ